MTNREYAATAALGRFFSIARSPVAHIQDRVRTARYRYHRWRHPPTPEQLIAEETYRGEVEQLVRVLETGYIASPGQALQIEDLSAVMSCVTYCGRCPLVLQPGAPRVPCTHTFEVSQWQKFKWWAGGLLPIRVVTNAWSWYEE